MLSGRLALFCVMYLGFGPYSAVVGPNFGPEFWAFRFLATAVSGQSKQRRKDHWERSATDKESGQHRFENGGQYVTGKQYVSGSAVSSIQNAARCPHCDQGHGAKLARLVYRMLRYGTKYVDQGAKFYEAQHRDLQIKQLKWKAAKLGFQVVQPPAA